MADDEDASPSEKTWDKGPPIPPPSGGEDDTLVNKTDAMETEETGNGAHGKEQSGRYIKCKLWKHVFKDFFYCSFVHFYLIKNALKFAKFPSYVISNSHISRLGYNYVSYIFKLAYSAGMSKCTKLDELPSSMQEILRIVCGLNFDEGSAV